METLIIRDDNSEGYITDGYISFVTHTIQVVARAKPKPASGLDIVLKRDEINKIRDIVNRATDDISKIVYRAVGREEVK